MRIPLNVRKTANGICEVRVPVKVMPRGVHARPVPVDFLVDTGSPWIAISPADAIKLNLPVSSLPKAAVNPTVLLGGRKFERRLLKEVDLWFKDEKQEIEKIKFNSLTVLKPTKKLSIEDMQLPSVLGCDFLELSKFNFQINISCKNAFLEK